MVLRRMLYVLLTAEKITVLHHPATPLPTTQLKTYPPTDRAPLTAAKPTAGFPLQREVGAGLLALKMMSIRRGRMTVGWLGDTFLATPSADETARVLLKPWPRVEGEWNPAMGMVLCPPSLLEQHQLI